MASDPKALVAFRVAGRHATLTLRPDATVLAVDDERVASYDLCGRPYVLVRDDATYRRALDGRLLEKRPGRLGGETRLRQVLAPRDAAPIVEAARREAEAARDAFAAVPRLEDETRADALHRLDGIVAMDAAALARDAARFASVYRPVGILPPDQHLALVLQATEGCSWNACAFCDLYRAVRFRAKGLAEFEDHVAAVRAFFGEALTLRRSVFLGGANALCLPHERLLGLLEVTARELPGREVHAFVDVFTGHRKGVGEYRAYAALGLRRVTIGLETGDPGLLAWLEKPGSPQQAVDLVGRLHEAGVAVGVVVLVGAGGERFAAALARATRAVLARMRLGREDLVYFSEIVAHPALAYARRMRDEGVRVLAPAELAGQRRSIAAAFADPVLRPRLAIYDIRDFVY